jgi:hypothetical protein
MLAPNLAPGGLWRVAYSATGSWQGPITDDNVLAEAERDADHGATALAVYDGDTGNLVAYIATLDRPVRDVPVNGELL